MNVFKTLQKIFNNFVLVEKLNKQNIQKEKEENTEGNVQSEEKNTEENRKGRKRPLVNGV